MGILTQTISYPVKALKGLKKIIYFLCYTSAMPAFMSEPKLTVFNIQVHFQILAH